MPTIIGVDFSGAALAGRKIWVSRASLENDVLHFHELTRGADLPGASEERAQVLLALINWITTFEAPVCGFDFPFALQAASIGDDWRTWLKNEVAPVEEADHFREKFPDARRQCDIDAKTPFSPLNKRLYRQTFYGLRDVIRPLLERGAIALPFDEPRPGATWLLEICPASLLKKEKLYVSYKGRSEAQRTNRETIWDEMTGRTPFEASAEAKQVMLDDFEGDALDAILAAVCVQRVLPFPNNFAARDNLEKIEGRVYF